jgi:hypothetical protein
MFEFDCVMMWLNWYSFVVQIQQFSKCEDVWELRLSLEFLFLFDSF